MWCRLPLVSLFTGAGGLDLGLEAAGFGVAVAVELDAIRCETIKLNKPKWKLIRRDIRAISPEEVLDTACLRRGEVALVAGGPPCRPFSKSALWTAPNHNPRHHEMAQLILEFAEFVNCIRPLAFILENVPGLAGKLGRQLFNKFLSCLVTNYRCTWGVLNAVEYGVPQKRRRLFVIGIRSDLNASPRLPDPTHSYDNRRKKGREKRKLRAWVTAGRAIGELDDGIVRDDEVPRGKWGHLLKLIPPGKNYLWLTERGGGDNIFRWRSRYWNFLLKLHPNLPSWTIQALPGPYCGPFHWRNRRLRIAEVKRLQTFPDWWEVAGTPTKQWAQLGDAVPPLLAAKLGNSILRTLSEELGLDPDSISRENRHILREFTPWEKK
ncbi:MAG: DNA (cytosine-5-)-methyltransferase [Candidatus Hecatellales archaeon]|nr:MAG: DNA (cytosine-5-)-methyltransferase [Candidatus Hecatellales archaeon]